MQYYIEAAAHIRSEDCQGNPEDYWRCFATVVNPLTGDWTTIGAGATPEQARIDAQIKVDDYISKWSHLSAHQSLDVIVNKTPPLLMDDVTRALRLINKILQESKPS